jgi:hypothetical protein
LVPLGVQVLTGRRFRLALAITVLFCVRRTPYQYAFGAARRSGQIAAKRPGQQSMAGRRTKAWSPQNLGKS